MPGHARDRADDRGAACPGRRSSQPGTGHATPQTVSNDRRAVGAHEIRQIDEVARARSPTLPPKSCSTDENCGSTNRMKNSITQTAATSTNTGYCIASVSLRRIVSARARSVPSISSTWSSVPETSPTRTSATYIGGNSAG